MAFPKYTRNPTQSVTTTPANILESGTPSDLVGIVASSTNAADAYVQIFAKAASAVTVGTTAPDMVVIIPKTTGVVSLAFPAGLHSETGWCFAVTTTDNGTTVMTYGNTIDLTFLMN